MRHLFNILIYFFGRYSSENQNFRLNADYYFWQSKAFLLKRFNFRLNFKFWICIEAVH